MSVTMGTPVQLGPRAWRLSWSSDLPDPTFYVWRDGRLLMATAETSSEFSVPVGESLVVEVLDDADELPESHWPPRARLEWQGSTAVDHYRVEEYVGAAWTLRAKVPDHGEGRFHWESRVLEDETTHQFRVIPVGTNGNQGTARSFEILMVRVPDVPEVDYAYDEDTGKVTVTA